MNEPTIRDILISFAVESMKVDSLNMNDINLCESAIKKLIKKQIMSKARWENEYNDPAYRHIAHEYLMLSDKLFAEAFYSEEDKVYVGAILGTLTGHFKSLKQARSFCESELEKCVDNLLKPEE